MRATLGDKTPDYSPTSYLTGEERDKALLERLFVSRAGAFVAALPRSAENVVR